MVSAPPKISWKDKLTPYPSLNKYKTDIVKWAEDTITLPTTTARPGQLRLDAWQRGVLKAWQDYDTRQLTVMSSSQIGKTLISTIALSFAMVNDPQTIMFIQPTSANLDRLRVEKIKPLILHTPELKSVISNTAHFGAVGTDIIPYVGGQVFFVNSGSLAQLRGTTARMVLFDEVDAIRSSSKINPIGDARQRGAAFRDSKLMILSTPTHEDRSIVNKEYNNGTKSVFEIPCQQCGTFGTLEWANIDNGVLHCGSCDEIITDEDRWESLELGRWLDTNSSPHDGHKSFHINRLYSRSHTIADIIAEHNPSDEQSFYEHTLGLPYKTPNKVIKKTDQIRERYVDDDPPNKKIRCRTIGVDVQSYRLEAQVVDWMGDVGMTPHVRSHTIFKIDGVDRDKAWRNLAIFVRKMEPDMTFIDSQPQRYRNYEHALKRFATPLSQGKCKMVKGGGRGTTFHRTGGGVVWKSTSGSHFMNIATDSIKLELHAKIDTGDITINRNKIPPNFAEQILAEELRGEGEKMYWHATARANEAIDCWVYAYAARVHLGMDFKKSYASISFDDLRRMRM